MTQFDLRQQDCIKGMSRLRNESVDLVVTSPPYNLGIGYSEYADRQNRQSYLKWCAKWAAEIRRILRSNGSFFLNVGSAPSNPMLPYQIVIELTSASGGFLLQNAIHWIKSITIDTKRSDPHLNPLPGQGEADAKCQVRVEAAVKTFGHFKPINSKRFLNDCHEHIFHFTKSGRIEIDRLALGVPYPLKATSRAGRILVGAIYAVAATHGSFPTRQFRAAQRNDRIRRRFLFNSPNGASDCTASRGSKRCSIRFWALAIPLSLRSAAG
jgi:hypothetical protein